MKFTATIMAMTLFGCSNEILYKTNDPIPHNIRIDMEFASSQGSVAGDSAYDDIVRGVNIWNNAMGCKHSIVGITNINPDDAVAGDIVYTDKLPKPVVGQYKIMQRVIVLSNDTIIKSGVTHFFLHELGHGHGIGHIQSSDIMRDETSFDIELIDEDMKRAACSSDINCCKR